MGELWPDQPDLLPETELPLHEFLTVAEVAAQLRVSRQTVYAWLKTGKLVGLHVGSKWRIERGAVEAFIQAQARPPLAGRGEGPTP